mgnify:CR=1 FL=1
MENLLSIGNVAKIFNISVSSLRHYENIGILVPEYVDTETGYRYYSERQLEVINTISCHTTQPCCVGKGQAYY